MQTVSATVLVDSRVLFIGYYILLEGKLELCEAVWCVAMSNGN